MKNLSTLFTVFLFIQLSILAQEYEIKDPLEPGFFKQAGSKIKIKEFPKKSFYESKNDWQYIIDTTWGPGLPLEDKREIFNTFVEGLENNFDGFNSLGFTQNSWDSLKNHYYSKIDSSTSRGRFCAIMTYFSLELTDLHTYAYDNVVAFTQLYPGLPYLILTGFWDRKHFGAVVTVLPDSSVMVLRVVDNHPLNLEPGDIILGYNGVKWIDLIEELMEAELPIRPFRGACPSSLRDALFLGIGMNWHLFDTIDILKYSSGDTLHLSLAPMLNLNCPSFLNNEQLEIPGIPFPDYFNDEHITYGILEGTNIGYIYIFAHGNTGMNTVMRNVIDSLKNTEGLIIDMRWCMGGWTYNTWPEAFGVLSNDEIFTLRNALRCAPTNWNMCFTSDSLLNRITGNPPDKYQYPIALLLSQSNYSMADRNSYRLTYLDNVRTFGKSTSASLGTSNYITNFPEWTLRYSEEDLTRVSDLNYFLNRKEIPIDFPIWHNKDDVAQGRDAVVETALEWMGNLVYGHDVNIDSNYYYPGIDTVNISAFIENPNSNSITAKIFIENLEETFIDSIDLAATESAELWEGKWITPGEEDVYKLKIKTIDNTLGESFTFSNMQRFTSAGPIVIDSVEISYVPSTDVYQVKPHIKNCGLTMTLDNLNITMSSDDTTITSISGNLFVYSIAPLEIIIHPGFYTVKVNSNFSGDFTFNFEIKKDGWLYWEDSFPHNPIITYAANEITLPVSYRLYQNYPNPFNPTTTIKFDIPERSKTTIKLYGILGNEIKTLVNEEKPAGTYKMTWVAEGLSSGVYFYQLKAGAFVETKKMILMK